MTIETLIVPKAGGVGLILERGDHLQIVNTEGGQSGDLMAFSPDGSEQLSNGRSFDYCQKIYLSLGDVLWSDRSNPMLIIVEDDTGRHDFLYAPCSLEMYQKQYGVAPDGRLSIKPPRCPPGSKLRLRAEMDLAVAVSSCPATTCNGGAAPRPLTLEVFRHAAS